MKKSISKLLRNTAPVRIENLYYYQVSHDKQFKKYKRD